MNSDENSFGGEVVLDSVNMACRSKESILYQQYFRTFIMEILDIAKVNKENAYLQYLYSTLKEGTHIIGF